MCDGRKKPVSFLRPGLASGWCRLSVRQVPGRQNEPWLSWAVYLNPDGTPAHSAKSTSERETVTRSPGPKVGTVNALALLTIR